MNTGLKQIKFFELKLLTATFILIFLSVGFL